ncbi:MAG TPA: thioesterase domain-containing protein [Xanthobacteraceae bacterium]|nr:thioesterase domain-containing protein [Xanthobacteraceae bacterium]
MRRWLRLIALATLAAAATPGLGSRSAMAQSHAHVYLFRGLADVFSTGMDTLADELNRRGVHATSHSHTDWKVIADRAAADYKAKKEGPIILIGHSLGADAAMEMADYLGDKGVPVALVVPFDGTQSFPAPGNVARVINFTQRDYAYMRPGPGFRGSLSNIDLSSNPDLNHLNIDKSPELHARVIREVLAIVGGNRAVAPAPAKPASIGAPAQGGAEEPATAAPAGEKEPKIAAPPAEPKSSAAPAPLPTPQPASPPRRLNPAQIPD